MEDNQEKFERTSNAAFRRIYVVLALACAIGGFFNAGLFLFAFVAYVMSRLME